MTDITQLVEQHILEHESRRQHVDELLERVGKKAGGAAVGQDLEAIRTITGWAKAAAQKPVLVKLTPNITDIVEPGRAAAAAGADGLALINTLKSLMGVDLDRFCPHPIVDGKSSHGGFAGAAVKPVALYMVAALARDADVGVPLSGIGGIGNWRDAVEFLLAGATALAVGTTLFVDPRTPMHICAGLADFLSARGFTGVRELIGKLQ